MNRVLVGRQPIFHRDMQVLGYELLYRDSEENAASFVDGDRATAETICNTAIEAMPWPIPSVRHTSGGPSAGFHLLRAGSSARKLL